MAPLRSQVSAAPPHGRALAFRVPRPCCRCAVPFPCSVFRLHNETVNIWSHALGGALFVLALLHHAGDVWPSPLSASLSPAGTTAAPMLSVGSHTQPMLLNILRDSDSDECEAGDARAVDAVAAMHRVLHSARTSVDAVVATVASGTHELEHTLSHVKVRAVECVGAAVCGGLGGGAVTGVWRCVQEVLHALQQNVTADAVQTLQSLRTALRARVAAAIALGTQSVSPHNTLISFLSSSSPSPLSLLSLSLSHSLSHTQSLTHSLFLSPFLSPVDVAAWAVTGKCS